MAIYSNILAWRILWTVDPGELLSIGSHRVGYNWSDLACMNALEKEMATHSNILAWRIPGTQKPGGLPSVGLHRFGHDWSNLAAAAEETYLTYLKVIKAICDKWVSQVTSYQRWKTESISSRIKNKTRMPTLMILSNLVLEILAIEVREEKNKRNPNWKGRSKIVTVCRSQDTMHIKS